jgi:hypothetical protein
VAKLICWHSNTRYLRCKTSQHPCNSIIRKPPPARSIRKLANGTAKEDETLANGTASGFDLEDLEYKRGLEVIHLNATDDTVANLKPNRVLEEQPPEINKGELSLPRHARSTLAQLRAGWSKILNTYTNTGLTTTLKTDVQVVVKDHMM